jgi:hypothetical protein
MVREFALPETAVRMMLKRLENQNAILVISRSPLTILVKTTDYNPLAGTETQHVGSYDRFLNAEATRHRLGRFIGEVEAKTGRGPTLRQMMSFLQFDNAGWVSRAAEMLVQRGLVQFGRGVPTKLTALGKQFYGIKTPVTQPKEKKVDTVTETRRPAPKSNQGPRHQQFLKRTTREVGQYLALHRRGKITARRISEDTGHARSSVMTAMYHLMDQGLVEPRNPKTKLGYKLTPEGYEKFGGQPAPKRAYTPRTAPVETVTQFVEASREPAYEPPAHPAPAATPTPMLASVDTADLVLELIERGYVVKRG